MLIELTSDQVEIVVKEDLNRNADTLENLSINFLNEELANDYFTILQALDYYGEQREPSETFKNFHLDES